MEKFYLNFYKDIVKAKSVRDNSLKKFLFSTMSNTILVFYLASKHKATLEELCYNIPPRVISRSTVQNILKEGTKILFFEKEINPNDKRAKYYKLTQQGNDILNEWVLNQKNNFDEVLNKLKVA